VHSLRPPTIFDDRNICFLRCGFGQNFRAHLFVRHFT
jgi:hypothetical protein